MTALTRFYRAQTQFYLDHLLLEREDQEVSLLTRMDTVLPPEIWRKIIGEALPHASNSPVYYAEFRAIVASVCKIWRFRVYNDQTLWSYICVNQHVLSESLDFVLARCPTALLDIRIALLDFDTRYGATPLTESVAIVLHRILSKISPTSRRWRSFFLITEHPEAFMVVYRHFQNSPVPLLRTFTAHCTLMEGYSNYEVNDPIYLEPVNQLHWFGGNLPSLTGVDACGIRMPDSLTSFASNLVTCNISQGYSPSLFTWEFFVELFSTAIRLRHIKLADILVVALPGSSDQSPLKSTSLQVLDLTLDADGFGVCFMKLMIVPNLSKLTLRVDRTNAVESLRLYLPKLHAVRRFCLHGSLGFDDDFYALFGSLPKLRVLDLQHADEQAFIAYCGWTYMNKIHMGEDTAHCLQSLSVGMVDVGELVGLVRFHDGRDEGPMNLRHVRMDHCIAVWEIDNYSWLCAHVADFGVFQPTTHPIYGLSGSEMYSAFVFH
ncbi:hypothetical protein C8F04DRAFT_1178237 [Mycena alexandri]|uniref:F-box domain-containing protein n=1 Tax=Mycena alexandri TaxID=1745969 RepID=A0AAD6TA53_9AGAR|nr:hypothetical protein C8F04DRAFT_1178237 [Mycena alexandri]